MRRCFEDSIEGQTLIDEVEEVSPIPGIVFHDSMRIQLDEQVEDEQDDACQPAQCEEQPALVWTMKTCNGEEAVRYEVTHQDQIYNAPEYKPGVVLKRSVLELVVLGNLGLHLSLEELVDLRVWVLARLRVFKDVRVLCPKYKTVVLGLDIEEPANACILGGARE